MLALLRLLTARARRGRKTLHILGDENLVSEASALNSACGAWRSRTISSRAEPARAAVHWSRDLDRSIRRLARAGLRRLTGRGAAA
jgi:hypothetical protein